MEDPSIDHHKIRSLFRDVYEKEVIVMSDGELERRFSDIDKGVVLFKSLAIIPALFVSLY